MTAKMVNSWVGDLLNSYSIGRKTRDVGLGMFFLCKLKEEGVIVFKHIPWLDYQEGSFKKHVDAGTLPRHSTSYGVMIDS